MRPFERILVVAPAQIGDMLICTPLIRAARTLWPDARIDVLGFAGTMALLKGNPDVADLIEVARSQSAKAQLAQALRLWRRYDLSLITRTTDRAHLYGFMAARHRSGLVPGHGTGSRWKRWTAQHCSHPVDNHQVLEKLQLIRPWMPELPDSLSLVPPAAKPLPPEIEAQLRRPSVAVQVPSMWRYKQWPTAHYRNVVQGLLADGVQVILTGSESDHDQSLIAQVRDAGPGVLDVSGRIDLSQVRSLLERVDAYLGPDTSVTHLAAALGVPIVSVYGPTLPAAFAPWPPAHPARLPWQQRAARQQVHNIVMLQGPDLPDRRCVPCGGMGCENRHDSASHCLENLPPERVLAELRAMLRGQSVTAPAAG